MMEDLSDIRTPDLIQELWRRYPAGVVCAFDYTDDGGETKTGFASSGNHTALLGILYKLRIEFESNYMETRQ
jgi:hypothetical protein